MQTEQEVEEVDDVAEYVDHETTQVAEETPYISDDILITHDNFHEYFFDVKTHKPRKGQILAKYSAMAELVKGEDKSILIKMLMQPDKALAAAKYLQKVLLSTENDSFRVSKEIANDLIIEMRKNKAPWKKVLNKPYKYQVEAFFYTWPECVPQDPHWECITLKNLDAFLEGVVKQAVEKANSVTEDTPA